MPRGPKRRPLIDRFWEKVEKTDSCWIWIGARIPQGYGAIGTDEASQEGAHRVAYRLLVGPIPPRAHVHHTCRNKLCVNPAHLTLLQPRAHLLEHDDTPPAKNVTKTHCPQGHPYTGANLYVDKTGRRHCRKCMRAAQARWRGKRERPDRAAP